MLEQVKGPSFIISSFKHILVVFFLIATINTVFAQGDLLVNPKRIVFEGRKNIKKLLLANTGKDTAVYKISFIEYKMDENGEMIIISEAEQGQRFASSHVRVYPRKVVLGPGEGQTVKVQLTNTQNLTEGEYRSHLHFRADKINKPLGLPGKEKDSAIFVKLEAVFGISIPCIIRKGENTTRISISDLQFSKENDELQFNLNRKGNMSAYGDFTINYISTDNTSHEVARMKGVGVYVPGTVRKMSLHLQRPEGIHFSNGKFKVVYTVNESKKVIAEAEQEI